MFMPLLRAIAQLTDPRILGALLASLALSALCFFLLSTGCAALIHHWLAANAALQGQHFLSGLISAVGGIATLVSAVWLYLPLTIAIAGLFQEPVCRAVEARWYPALAPAQGPGLLPQMMDALSLALRMGLYSLVSLALSLIFPGFGLLLGFLITAWGLGRGMFVTVAFRRMGLAAALQAYHAQSAAVMFQGILLAGLGCVPVLNLLLPVLGPACMVHMVLNPPAGAPPAPKSWG